MSKLDDCNGALSAAAVVKETLKDRVTQLDGKVDHLGNITPAQNFYLQEIAKYDSDWAEERRKSVGVSMSEL